jgi:trigger factor
MQVVEKSIEGLSHSYVVTIPIDDLTAQFEARVQEIAPTLSLKGFRPGKVPPGHVKRLYGKALMGEVVEKSLNDSASQVLSERSLRVATQPEVKPVSDMEAVLAGAEDLKFDFNVEVMPDFDPMDVAKITVTRPVYEPAREEIDEALKNLAEQARTYAPRKGKAAKAQEGDQVVIDFVGKIDGVAFDGGTATDVELVLGDGRFIPGFEPQLVGKGVGETVVNVTFPEDYGAEHLKGKAAVFDVTIKEVRAPEEATVDDALAERLGLSDLAALEGLIVGNIKQEYDAASRFKVKRSLLDALDAGHDIPLPARMVEAEFEGIWRQVEADRAAGEVSPEDEGKSDDELKAEYRKIAERRVRLGLVLAEIGRRADVQVTEAELANAMREEARKYGAQAQQIFDFLRNSPEMQVQMRAPVYEEKVVDLILTQATVIEKPVTKEELLAEDDAAPAPAAEAKPAKKPAKKAAPKAKAEDDAAPAAEAKPKARKKAAKADE